MKKPFLCALSTLLLAAYSCPVSAALLSDNFDVDSSANYTVLQDPTPFDSQVDFAYDYSVDGIPAAPGSATTLGAKFQANIVSPSTTDAITIVPTGNTFAGDVQLRFHMWMNANGPFPAGGTGSTEFMTAGILHDSLTVNRSGTSGSGAWFAVSGEGGTSRDYRAHLDGTENTNAATYAGGGQNANPNYATQFPGIDVAAVNGGALTAAQGANQTGTTGDGAMAFAWRDVIIARIGDTVTWKIDGNLIATLDVTGQGDGNIAIGYHDPFSSVSSPTGQAFGLIDNLVVTVPEPASLALLGLSLVGLALGRKRR